VIDDSDVAGLVRGFRGGDPEIVCAALQGLYNIYKRGIYNFLRGRVRDPRDAEDLLHETFLSALKARGTFSPDEASLGEGFSKWIYAIAKNEWRQHGRSRRQEPTLPLDEDLAQLKPGDDRGSRMERWNGALNELVGRGRLTRREADMLWRRVIGFSNAEIAQEFGMPEETVKKTTQRTYPRLRNNAQLRLLAIDAGIEITKRGRS